MTDLTTDAPLLRTDQDILSAVERLLESGLPALPVIDDREELCGVFGEREFFSALFPGYLSELKYAAFVPSRLDEAIDKRAGCRAEKVGQHMNTEHVDVQTDFSDAQLAETFMHHRVLIVPVLDGRRVAGIVTRSDFFRRLAQRFVDAS